MTVDVGPNFPTVSRRHAEIVSVGPDRYKILDLGSTNGTEIWENGRWKPVNQAIISSTQRFRLGGRFETTLQDLVRLGYKAPSFAAPAARQTPLLADRWHGAALNVSMVLGILGGIIGLADGLSDYAVVGMLKAVLGKNDMFDQLVLIASPVCSIIGGAIVRSNPVAGGALMAVNLAAPLLFFGLHAFPFLPVLLSGFGAAAALLTIKNAMAG